MRDKTLSIIRPNAQYPDNCRWAVLNRKNRKNRLTHFLDTLRGTLVELSQK
ncbi:hypothetical protein [Alistipes sp. An54]|uniref:hypothetical protein n=1 Tax=Alistipes sp. An54 TaxID=1965645 RepID=UPI0013A68179|nr:hypothetical protein [Alistipes sp. An54]